jgi:hypothetical protein
MLGCYYKYSQFLVWHLKNVNIFISRILRPRIKYYLSAKFYGSCKKKKKKYIYVRLGSTSVSNRHPILKYLSDLYVTEIYTSGLFSNRRPMTSLTYASNAITPVRRGFWRNDGEALEILLCLFRPYWL